jgi:hypothetical protein
VLLLTVGCATFHAPGPLGELGRPARETAAQWIARHGEPRENHESDGALAEGEGEGEPSERPAAGPAARAVARAANGFVGDGALVVDGERYRFDCSGLVEASLAKAGIPQTGSTAMLYERARELGVLHRRKLPRPGDVAFFDDTYDRNGNGRIDDPLSHSAVVTRVRDDGQIEMVHVGSKGVVTLQMNLRRPGDHFDDDGAIVNDYLRQATRRDPEGTRVLAGELWTAFASFYEVDSPVASE